MKNGSYTDRAHVSSHFDKEGSYWLSKLSGDLVKSCFPYDYPEKVAGEIETGEIEIDPGSETVKGTITGELFQKLMKLSGSSDPKLHIILAAGLMALLNRYTGNTDIIVGTPIYKPEKEGQYINTVLALRNHVDRQMSFKNLLVEVRKTVIEAVEHANFPMNTLWYQLGLPGSPHDFPLFDIAILLENIQDKRHIQHVRPRMVFSFKRTQQCVEGTVEYNASLYEKDTIERIFNSFIRLMQHTLGDIDGMISEIHLLAESERKRLLIDLNRTDVEYPKNKTIHRLFEEQVERTPDHTVIIHADKHFTYKDLNRRANRLARVLRKKGVKQDTLVGLMIERSFELLMGILAVLKAGGAYIPIDPQTPKERILTILKDCRTSILLTDIHTLDSHSIPALQSLEFGKIEPHTTGKRAQIKDLDSLPLPDRSLVNYDKYNEHIGIAMAAHTISMQTSRGCPYNCCYCHKIWPKTHVFRSAEHIFSEVQLYYNMGVKRFTLVDDIFNLDKKNTMKFYNMIIKNNMKVHFFYPNGVRTDILTKDYIDLMVEAGTIQIACALETASPRLQKLIGKNLNLEKFRENVEYISEKYPHIILDILSMTGFPTETEEESLRTLDFLKSIHWLHFPNLAAVKVYPNTEMETLALKSGISKEAIERSLNLAFHELPETLPFGKEFMLEYQTDYLNNYFLKKERLFHVLPAQMKVFTEDEMIQKYNSYLPANIERISDVLELAGFSSGELEQLGQIKFIDKASISTAGITEKMIRHFPVKKSDEDALRILLLDVSNSLPDAGDRLNILLEVPLGLICLLTYLNRQFGSKINGKIVKSLADFTTYTELRRIYEEFNPDVIGIRSLSFHNKLCHRVASMLRQWGFAGPMITGGPYATSSCRDILQDRNFDMVVLGEGEVTFAELIGKILENNKKLPAEEALREIGGIAFLPGKIDGKDKMAQEVIMVDGFADALSKESARNLEYAGNSTDLAYCMFTSGSTGRPKGVMIPHRGVVNYLWWAYRNYLKVFEPDYRHRQEHQRSYPYPKTVFPLYSSISFDMTVTSILTPVISGNIVDIYSGEYNEVLIEQVIEKNRSGVLKLTPSHLKLIKNNMLEGSREQTSIGTLILGGEDLETRLAAEARENFGEHVEIYNEYGPTETVVGCMIYRYGPGADSRKSVPIGVPIDNTRVYLLDANRVPVSVGAAGELFISGDGVGRGYVNSPGLTRERFVENPFSPGKQMYRSGDLARWLPDGNMEFLGRVDHQVKIRGFRIELGEIENQLITHKGIEDAVVIAINDVDGSKSLAAYFIPSPGGDNPPGAAELREYLSSRLPDYMIPVYMMAVEKIPLTPGGKLDRKRLPEPELKLSGNYIAPRDELEEKLVRIWSDLLGITDSKVGINDNFFELGGHSLKATFLISLIHKEFNVKIALMEIFRGPTIRGLAGCIRGAVEDRFIAVKPVEVKEYYVQSSEQKRMYVLQQIDSEGTAYNLPQIYPVEEALDRERLENTFRKLIQRHENLRTSFHFIDGKAVQKIHREVEFTIEYFNRLDEGAKGNFVRSFDLWQAPLLRVRVVKKAPHLHLMFVDMHHIISDGISHLVLMQDFHRLYRGEAAPELKLQYKDYAEWQAAEKQQKEVKKQEAYWLSIFAGDIPVLDLPVDHPRPMMQSFEGNYLVSMVGKEETRELKGAASKEDATLFMIVLALFNVLLSKLSGQEEIIVGNPTAGRRHADLEKIIGMFVTTLPMWNSLSPGIPFNRFLRDVKERTLAAFENQEYPFEDLVERLSEKVTRDVSRNPIFDVVFVLQNQGEITAVVDESLVDGFAENQLAEYRTAKFDLTLTVSEVDDQLLFRFEYCTKLFKKRTIERYIRYFKKIISTVTANPGTRISEIGILTGEEKEQILHDFNDTASGYPEDKTLHQLFAEQAAGTPDGVAVVGSRQLAVGREGIVGARHAVPLDGIQLTYRELNEKSNQLAYQLLEKGVRPGCIVGIMMGRSVEMIAGMLGILKAGGAYLPIEPDYPGNRITYMLKDSGARVLLTLRESSDITGFTGEIVDVTDKEMFAGAVTDLPNSNGPGDLVYVIYTSGTTGHPKGTAVEHRNVVRLMVNSNHPFNFDSRDVWTMFHSYGFDFSVWEMYGALLYGGKLIVIPRMVSRDPAAFLDVLKDNGVTVLNQTPSAFYNLINETMKRPGLQLSLRYVIFGGEALQPGKLKTWKAAYPAAALINMFGITETTVHVTFKEIGDHEIETNIGNIGGAIPTLSTYIMDDRRRLLPFGVSGELCVGGDGVARGYLNRPELTAVKFVPNPHKPDERLYCSGDLAKWLDNGDLVYLGRKDHQVKIRGFRVEPGEIENRLLKHGGINEVVVVARKGKADQAFLCAYFVPGSEGDNREGRLTVRELREYLLKELPGYMVPSYFVPLVALPLTSSAKIDKKMLPDPLEIDIASGIEFVAPRNEIEEEMAEIWRNVLGRGRQKVGIHDNFFMLGGDSIKSIQIASRMKTLGYDLSIKDLFLQPTIAELAPLLKKVEQIADQSVISGQVPLTPIQKAFFMSKKQVPNHYNQAVLLYSHRYLEDEAVRRVFTTIQAHHDALRMTFTVDENGEIRQIDHGLDYPFDFQVFDLRRLDNAVERLESKANDIQASMNLETGPLMKVTLFHLDDGDRLLVAIHHLVMDGISWRILFEDIGSLYTQYTNREELTLPLKTGSFKVWAERLSQYADSGGFLKEKTYWAELEAEIAAVRPIQKDFPGEANVIKDTGTRSFKITQDETQRLLSTVNEAFAAEINDILLTALGRALKKTFARDKMVIALEGHGREEILPHTISTDITRTVGWFTSVYPVLLDVSYENDLDRQIKEVKEALRRVPNKGMGYGMLKYLTAEEHKRDITFQSAPQVSFNYLGQFDADTEQMASFKMAGESGGRTMSLEEVGEYELDVSGILANHCLNMSVVFNPNQYRPETIDRLINHFESQLKTIISHCTRVERRQLTPSDFTYKGLSIDAVDALTSQIDGEIEDIYTLSPMQEGMLFHALYDADSSAYFEHAAFRLQGELEPTIIQKSLNELAKRYDVLRTMFYHEGLNRPIQVVLKDRPLDFYYEDIGRAFETDEAKKTYMREFKEKDIKRSFNLSRDPLMRVAILQMDQSEYEFIWSHHHLLMDGWCLGILIQEFLDIYRHLRENKPYHLPAVIKYKTYIQWLEKQDKEKSGAYWSGYLQGYEEIAAIPGMNGYPAEKREIYKNENVVLSLEVEKTRELNRLATRNQVTLNTVIHAVWGIILGKYTGKQDVVFGAVVSGRPSEVEGVESMVGLFINTIPVRIRCEADTPFRHLLRNIQLAAIESESHHYYPLAEIQAEHPLKHNLLHHPMAFENYPIARQIEGVGKDKDDKTGIDQEPFFRLSGVDTFEHSNYDFSYVVSPGNALVVKFIYNGNVYNGEFIRKIAAHVNHVLDQVLISDRLAVRAFSLLSEEEKQQVLAAFNDTRRDYPAEMTIHQLFEQQAEKTPDRVALQGPSLEGGDTISMTYDQLKKTSDRLARMLRCRGVTGERIVGILVEHSVEMLVGILAILKAGGAYVPIDSGTPQNRIVSILNDCGASILLSTARETEKYTFTTLQDFQLTDVEPHLTPGRPQVKDFNGLPIPDRSLVDYEKYSKRIGMAMAKNTISVQATRGCPYKCLYCHKIWPKTHVMRSAEHIFSEVQLFYNMGVRRFTIVDDIFNLNKENSSRFFELIIKNGLDLQLFFGNGVRGDILTRDYIDLMVEAGTINVALALETASPRLQKLIGKNIDLDKLHENMDYICRKHPHVISELFTMLGFPTETGEEAMMTLDFIKSLKWVHLPVVSILKIYPNTDMANFALENGISLEAIVRSQNLAYHELPETLPFDKEFTVKYQTDFFSNYLVRKERLLHVLPYKMKALTEDEIVQKYDSVLPTTIGCFDDLLRLAGIRREELSADRCLDEARMVVPGLNQKIRSYFPGKKPAANALRVILLDVSQFFSGEVKMLYDVVEPPLGLMYVMTYLNKQLGGKVYGKVAKSRIDFDSYTQLKSLLEEFNPDIIGLRTLNFYKEFFHKTAAVIRQWGFGGPIVAGGPYATSEYQRILQDRNIDVVVMGEGEITFADLVEKIIQNGGKLPGDDILKEIKGIAFMPGKEKEKARKGHCREILMLDTPINLPDERGNEDLEHINRPGRLAYNIFTSGSTGKPKGVLVDHRNVVRLVKNTDYVEFREGERLLQTGAVAFDASTFEMWGALLNGLTLHLAGKTDILTPERLKEIIRKNKIDTMWMTSPLFNRMLETDSEIFTGLTNLLVGGDELSPVHINKLRHRFPALNIINGYGPTENTTFSVTHLINKDYKERIPIGNPIANSTAYILDRYFHPLPVGIPGQLCVGGDGVSRGYSNDPELTHEKFIVHPFLREERLYRTGDQARWLSNGEIEFLGRLDRQIKIRGFRIELGEIETQLLKVDYIKEAIVTGAKSAEKVSDDEDYDGDKFICAYIVSEQEVDYPELRDKLSKDLPDYMIPAYFISLERIPLTPNGKVDWKSLPDPEAGILGEDYVAPHDEMEKRLVRIWSEVLGIREENIGINTSFFDLGGHSLKVTVLATKIHKEFNVKIPLEEVFVSPAIRQLAGYIKGAARVKYTAVQPVPKKEYYPLSSSQKRMYFVQQMNWEDALYNVPIVEVLEWGIDKIKLEDVFRKLIARHECLRTSFEMVDETPVQRIHEDVEFVIRYFEISNNSNKEEESQEIIRNWIKPFDLSRPPLLRVGIIELGETRHLLLIDMPHIITDGISMSILTSDFMVLSRGGTLPGIPLQYKDYACWQNNYLNSPGMEMQKEYWLSRFNVEIPVLNIPTDYPRQDTRSFEGSYLQSVLDKELVEKLRELVLKNETTLFTVLIAVYFVLLSRYTGQEDIVVATGVAGRTHADLQHVIGMFINMLPLRNQSKENNTFREFLKHVKKNALDAFENQDYPFEELVRTLKLREQGGRQPIFDTVFELTGSDAPGNSRKYSQQIEYGVARYDLVIMAVESGENITIYWEYPTALFKESTIKKMAERYHEILKQVLEDEDIKLKDIEIAHDYIPAKTGSIQGEFGF
jgi:amino acid adenylation domain-containing protein/non-ribosomal peptide synthase protein (TIGR01720 family)